MASDSHLCQIFSMPSGKIPAAVFCILTHFASACALISFTYHQPFDAFNHMYFFNSFSPIDNEKVDQGNLRCIVPYMEYRSITI